jgi:hypothetical protein
MFALKQKETDLKMKEYESQALMQQAQAQERLQGNFEQNRQLSENMAAANMVGTIAPQIMGMNAVGQQATAPQLPMSASDLPDYTSNLRNYMVQQENANARNEQDAIAEMLTKQMANQQALTINDHNVAAKAFQAEQDRKNKLEIQQMKVDSVLSGKNISANNAQARKQVSYDVNSSKNFTNINNKLNSLTISGKVKDVAVKTGGLDSGETTETTKTITNLKPLDVLSRPDLYDEATVSSARTTLNTYARQAYRPNIQDKNVANEVDSFIGAVKKRINPKMSIEQRQALISENLRKLPAEAQEIINSSGYIQNYIMYSLY